MDLLRAALSRTPGKAGQLAPDADLRALDPEAVVFIIEYTDGFRAAAYLSRGLVQEFAFAAKVKGREEPITVYRLA